MPMYAVWCSKDIICFAFEVHFPILSRILCGYRTILSDIRRSLQKKRYSIYGAELRRPLLMSFVVACHQSLVLMIVFRLKNERTKKMCGLRRDASRFNLCRNSRRDSHSSSSSTPPPDPSAQKCYNFIIIIKNSYLSLG